METGERKMTITETDNVVTITDIAKQLKISPKVARARLRKLKDVPATIDKATWSWRKAQVDRVKALLKDA
jgi:hypothetical protein